MLPAWPPLCEAPWSSRITAVKIALIHARISHNAVPPLGLLGMAAVLRDQGFDCRVWDPLPGDVGPATLSLRGGRGWWGCPSSPLSSCARAS